MLRSYVNSATIFASAGLIGSMASVLIIIAGLYASWKAFFSSSARKQNVEKLWPIWIGVLSYCFANLISEAANSIDFLSVSETIERLPYLFLPPLIVLIAGLDHKRLFHWSVLGAACGAAMGLIYVLVTGDAIHTRVEAFSGNPNVYGYTSNVLLILLCAGLVGATDNWIRIVCAFTVIIALFLIIASGSRTALIGGLATCFIMVVYCWPLRNVWLKIAAFSAIGALAIFVIMFTTIGDRIVSVYFELTIDDINYTTSNGQRIAIWTCGLMLGSEAPIFGLGHSEALERMNMCLNRHFALDFRFTHFHNVFIDQFAKAGIIGLLGVTLLIAMPLIFLAKMKYSFLPERSPFANAVKAGIFSLFTVQIVSGLVNIGFGHDVIDTMFIYTLAFFIGLSGILGTQSSVDTDKQDNMNTAGSVRLS